MKTKIMLITLVLIGVFSFQAFAGPQNCGRGCPGGGYRPCPPPCHPCHPCRPCPPPPCHRYHGCRGSSGVRLAADIVSLVGASLNVLRGPAVVAQPVAVPVTQPVAVPVAQPVPCTPYYNNGYIPMAPTYR